MTWSLLAQRIARRAVSTLCDPLEDLRYRGVVQGYDFGGYRRVYLAHIPKTGGTSLNMMFLACSGEDPQQLYRRLESRPGHRIQAGGLVFVGWNRRLIKKGDYFYSFSHEPLHRVAPPAGTFTFCALRDPVARVISHYTELSAYSRDNVRHASMRVEGKWLGQSFSDFLDRIPSHVLLGQLHAFSAGLDVSEAHDRASSLSYLFFGDEFEQAVTDINRLLGTKLEPLHVRKASTRELVLPHELERLEELLQPEYELLARLGLGSGVPSPVLATS